MKATRHRNLDFKQLAAFAQDLEESHAHRVQAPEDTEYALDANVIWFFQQQLDEEDENINDYVAAAIGAQQAASLIRTSIEKLSTKHRLTMMESHRYETDVAFASGATQNYDDLRSTLLRVFEGVLSKKSLSARPEDLPRQIVTELKLNHPEHFRLITDILGRKPQKKEDTDRLIRTLRPAPYDRVPPDLSKTLDKIGFILREGDGRPRFSVQQDIKALRDIALCNVAKGSRRVVLVTFDKRLLQAVRLVQSWNEPWAEYLALENCQTFWIWHLTDPKTASNPAASALQEVMDDFRRKSRQLFHSGISERDSSSLGDVSPLWLTHRTTLETLLTQHGNSENGLRTVDDSEDNSDLVHQVRDTLHRVDLAESSAPSESLEVIQKACGLFFREVEQILPSFGIIISEVFEREKILEQMLRKHGVQKIDFFTALNDEIQTHAKASLHILGASSLVAPKTIQAVYEFSRMDQFKPASRRFVHRVPLPIQSDEFDLVEVVKLVTNDQNKLEVRYDKLMGIARFAGPIADLTVAYVLASGGQWNAAEEICRGILLRRDRSSLSDPVYYETRLLLAAILRIYRTSFQKLQEAADLLTRALGSDGPRPSADSDDLRIRLEIVAISLNRLLLERHRAATSYVSSSTEMDIERASAVLQPLMELKKEAGTAPQLPVVLRDKINANINVNCCLLSRFLAPSVAVSIIGEATYGQILTESLVRVSSQAARISYFEEIIILFAVLNDPELVRPSDYKEVEIIGSLRTRLSRVLQKDQKTNDFEYWIYDFIQRQLHAIGY